ncbi:MAG: hypothetical protein IJW55_07040 [Clostridia bacterium]|nr:hypothetical protein [Clostridia bacterium]
MKKHYLFYAVEELKRRPFPFLGSFLVCLAGMYITFSMLFMQFGAYRAEVRTAEADYHICLPYLSENDIERIDGLSYVKSVSFVRGKDSYTAYIKVNNNDPYELKNQCDRIIKELGLDQTDAFADNLYYTKYGVQDNWINQQYYRLATDFFYGEVLLIILPLALFTVIGFCLSVRIKIKNNIDEYAALRTLGCGVDRLMKIIILQYSVVFLLAALLSLAASFFTIDRISSYTLSRFTDNFLQIDNQIPITETLVTGLIFYVLFLIMVQGCRKLLKQNIRSMLSKAQEYTAFYGTRAGGRLFEKSGIAAYNQLYVRRSWRYLLAAGLKNFVLFVLPFVFVALSADVYGMRAQADSSDYDYGVFYNDPFEVTDAILARIEENDLVERIEHLHPYDDGTYGGVYIYCKEGKAEDAKAFIETLAKENALSFTDHYHNAIMVREQSKVFSGFYLLQALVLFLAAIQISLFDAGYRYRHRTRELAVLRSMGVCSKELMRVYMSELFVMLLSFLLSIVFSFVIWNLSVGIVYVKPLYILGVLSFFTLIYLLGHLLLCKVHRDKLVNSSLSEKMKEIVS